MVHRRSDEATGLPVQQIAQMLVEAGQNNPALLGRSQVSSAGRIEGASERRPPVALEHHLSPAADPYMEQLVSIAVASARLAEDASVQASQTGRMAKRSASMVTVLGAIGGLVGIAGIVDHRYHDSVKPALAAVASDDRPIAEAQRPPGILPTKVADQPPERAPIDPVAQPSSPAPPPDTANRASGNEDGSGTTNTTRAPPASRVMQATNEPSGATAGQAYPTQPYGLYAPSSFRPTSSRAYASSLAQQWPSATRGSSAAKQYHYVPRRYEASAGSGPSGNPVRDFQRFVTAMGQGFRSIFR